MRSHNSNPLTRFGFTFGKGGAHTARTYMLEDLEQLLQYFKGPQSSQSVYINAIEEENCLGKRSKRTRNITSRHLIELYSLDPHIALFRNLLYLWERDPDSHSLLALLCSYVRDALFRDSAPFILSLPVDDKITRDVLEQFIEKKYPGRFSPVTLRSVTQNINGIWTKSGHLQGKTKKVRTLVKVTPGSLAYALFLGYITGIRGQLLFSTEYIRLLDCSIEQAISLAESASKKGWIVYKRIGDIMEVQFPNFFTKEEQGWIYEQN
jgi:hypothetical protein